MVYSEAFDNLPKALKNAIYRRMIEILGSDNPPKEFAHLSRAERKSIRQILLGTHDGFAAAWQQFSEARPAESRSQ